MLKHKFVNQLFLLMLLMLLLLPNLAFAIHPGADDIGKSISAYNLEQSIKFREDFGFEKNLDKVKEIINKNQSNGSERIFGVVLTDFEVKELEQRKDVAEKAVDLELYLDEKYKNSFGGLYIDQKSGGKLKIGLVDLQSKKTLQELIKKQFKYPERIEFFEAKNSYEQLINKQEELDNYWFENNLNILFTSISLQESKIFVGVSEAENLLVEDIYSQFGSQYIEVQPVYEFKKEKQDRTAKTRPLKGGLGINDTAAIDYVCTGAFSAKDSSSNYYYVTAAHCGNLNSNWYQGGGLIGSITKRVYGSSSDAAAIKISSGNASGWLYGSENGYNNRFTSVQNKTDDVVGDYVCKSGATTGVTCGQITNKNYTDVDGLKNQRLTSYSGSGGDSGGPVYYTNTDRWKKTLVGVHGATTTINGTRYGQYSHVGWILSDLGLTSVITQQ